MKNITGMVRLGKEISLGGGDQDTEILTGGNRRTLETWNGVHFRTELGCHRRKKKTIKNGAVFNWVVCRLEKDKTTS